MIPEINGDFLQQLKSFYFVATYGSVSTAANHMNRTQSAVTYQIQLLEKGLNIVLFLRIKNKMVLTDEGQALLKWTLKIFDDILGMHEDLQGDLQQGYLRIASTRPVFSSEKFVQTFMTFHEEYPNIYVSLNSGHPALLHSSIKNGQTDFGIIGTSTHLDDLDFIPLFQSPFLLVTEKRANFDILSITPETLKTLPYISFSVNLNEKISKYSLLPHEIQDYMDNASVLSCSNYYVIMKYVAMGFGCTIIDAFSLQSFDFINNIHIIDLQSIIPPLQYGLLIRKKSNMSKSKNRFIDILTTNLKNMNFGDYINKFNDKIHNS
ncbi:LysR family transcriptional regulator [uncultured Mailhella sp.]|uniref:LysR family transcriptional regulator n=1 Tax=uncultured Mailhella sp. TaxID=1981031 RepID=UPI0026024F04|nr:LysR family transcriptional regulator [uncultured Mailhella sp.]